MANDFDRTTEEDYKLNLQDRQRLALTLRNFSNIVTDPQRRSLYAKAVSSVHATFIMLANDKGNNVWITNGVEVVWVMYMCEAANLFMSLFGTKDDTEELSSLDSSFIDSSLKEIANAKGNVKHMARALKRWGLAIKRSELLTKRFKSAAHYFLTSYTSPRERVNDIVSGRIADAMLGLGSHIKPEEGE